MAIPILVLDLFLTMGLGSAALAVGAGLLGAAWKVAILLFGGSKVAQGLEEKNEQQIWTGLISIFGVGLLEGLDALDGVDAGLDFSGGDELASFGFDGDGVAGLIPELGSDGFGPFDGDYGAPSAVDGDLRVYHYTEPYVRMDGTPVAGHWKSIPG